MTNVEDRLAEAAVFIENLRINRESSAGYGGMVTERAHAGCGCWIDGRGAVQHHNCIVLRLRAAIEEATQGESVNQRYVRNATRLLDEARTEADTNLHRALTAETRVRELEEARRDGDHAIGKPMRVNGLFCRDCKEPVVWDGDKWIHDKPAAVPAEVESELDILERFK